MQYILLSLIIIRLVVNKVTKFNNGNKTTACKWGGFYAESI